ncbi:transport and Golgi organization protein 1 homolog isoform X2 [Mya arenaria]|uniref:transport and Golgi organization protein 1 homolog isoform X2 n=1 Tax=Mya arenaria TaxID=6604 RepID=UPI0022E8ED5F|nr:transport and Golgi organization protein 1 homolog isoform X2 [Mya arenaria]
MLKLIYKISYAGLAVLLLQLISSFAYAEKISNLRLCADRYCETIISKARSLARNKPTDPAFLAFDRGDIINVYSKSAGTRQDLWGGEVNGKRGYFPRSFVREYKVEIPNPQHTVETEPHVPIEDRIMGRTASHESKPTRQPPPNQEPSAGDQPPSGREPETVPVVKQAMDAIETETRGTEAAKETGQDVQQAQADQRNTNTQDVREEAQGDETERDETEVDETEINEETDISEEEKSSEKHQETDDKKNDDIDQNVPADNTEVDETEIEDETDISEDETEMDEVEQEPEDQKPHDMREEHKPVPTPNDKVPDEDSTEVDDTDLDSSTTKEKLSENPDEKSEGMPEIKADTIVNEDDSTEVDGADLENDRTEVEGNAEETQKNIESAEKNAEGVEAEDGIAKETNGEKTTEKPPAEDGATVQEKKHDGGDKAEGDTVGVKSDETEVPGKEEEGGSILGSMFGAGKVEDVTNNAETIQDEENDVNEPNVNMVVSHDSDVVKSETKIEQSDSNAGSQHSEQLNEVGNEDKQKERASFEQKDRTMQSAPDNDEHEYHIGDTDTFEAKELLDKQQVIENIPQVDAREVNLSDEKEDEDTRMHRDHTREGNIDISSMLYSHVDSTLSVTDQNAAMGNIKGMDKHVEPVEVNTESSTETKSLNLHDMIRPTPVLDINSESTNTHPLDETNMDLLAAIAPNTATDLSIVDETNAGPDSVYKSQVSSELKKQSVSSETFIPGTTEFSSIQPTKPFPNTDQTLSYTTMKTVMDTEPLVGLTNKNVASKLENTDDTDFNEFELAAKAQHSSSHLHNHNNLLHDLLAAKMEEEEFEMAEGWAASMEKGESRSLYDNNEDSEIEDSLYDEIIDGSIEITEMLKVKSDKKDNLREENKTINHLSSFAGVGKSIDLNKADGQRENDKSDDLTEKTATGHDFNEITTKNKKIERQIIEQENSQLEVKSQGLKNDDSKSTADSTNRSKENVQKSEEHVDKPNSEKDQKTTNEDKVADPLDTAARESVLARARAFFGSKPAEVEKEEKTEDIQQAEPEKVKEISGTENIDQEPVDVTSKREDGRNEQTPEELDKKEDIIDEGILGKFEKAFEAMSEEKEKAKSDKEKAETDQVLKKFEKAFEAMAKDKTDPSDDDESLKFVNEQGEIDDEQIHKRGETVEEMEIKEPVQKEVVSELPNENDESIADILSDTVIETGSLETQTENTDSTMIDATSSSEFIETQGTNIGENKGTVIDGTTFAADYLDETVASVTQSLVETKVIVQGYTTQTDSDQIEPSTVVAEFEDFDGTHIPANYISEIQDVKDSIQVASTEYQPLMQSDSDMHLPKDDKLDLQQEIPSQTDTQLSPSEVEIHSETISSEQTEGILDTTSTPAVESQSTVTDSLTATGTFKDVPTKTADTLYPTQTLSETAQTLGTSFEFHSMASEGEQTVPIETGKVIMETELQQNNETVDSHIVQDQVQPSLDQDAYKTDLYLSRKPLSTGVTESTETTTDSVNQNTDQNNNDPNQKNMMENVMDYFKESTTQPMPDYEIAPPTDTPPTDDPYSSEHMLSRKVPDPALEEEDENKPGVDVVKTLEQTLKALIDILPGSMQSMLEEEPLGLSPPLTLLVSMLSTCVLGVLTCVGCLCTGGKTRLEKKDPLVVIRSLEEKLFIATKEKENLEDEVQLKEQKISELKVEVDSQQSSSGTFETDLKTIQLHNESLKQQVSMLHQEITDNKHMISELEQECAQKSGEVEAYATDVEHLEHRANEADLALKKAFTSLSEKGEELMKATQLVESLTEQVRRLETRKQQLEDESTDWSEKVKELSEQVEQSSVETRRMQEDLAFKENELEVLRDCFLQVKAFQGEDVIQEEQDETPADLSEKLKQMMDVSRVNASLRAVEEERDVLNNKLAIEIESRQEMEDQMQSLKRKLEGGQTDKMKAERQCQEAQTKLEVLSKYFREKETELTRQLGEQEVLKNQNISKLQSSDSFTQELSQEKELYRQQVDDLKTEITKAERDFRSQIAANEKKAHENWLATRAAERELKESRHECGMLRQKLTDLERKLMQGPPPGLIRPITHRPMPPPGMLNGPRPPPPGERPGSRGSVQGRITPRLRDDDYRASPVGGYPPPPPDRRLPPGARPLPPHATSPPPFAIRPPYPGDRRSPPPFDRYPPPPIRGPRPPYPRPPPPHLRSPPPLGNSSELDDSRDSSRQDRVSPKYNRAPPPHDGRDRQHRHQSHV